MAAFRICGGRWPSYSSVCQTMRHPENQSSHENVCSIRRGRFSQTKWCSPFCSMTSKSVMGLVWRQLVPLLKNEWKYGGSLVPSTHPTCGSKSLTLSLYLFRQPIPGGSMHPCLLWNGEGPPRRCQCHHRTIMAQMQRALYLPLCSRPTCDVQHILTSSFGLIGRLCPKCYLISSTHPYFLIWSDWSIVSQMLSY
jgi:hypothetical protein